jgi:hypothetical protein
MYYPYFSLAHWAFKNINAARLLIFLLSIFSGVLFFETGLYLPEFTVSLASFIWLFTVVTAIYCFFSYKYGYRIFKRAIIYLSLSVLWLHLGNQSVQILTPQNTKSIEIASIAPITPIAKTEQRIRKFFKKQLSKRKKQLRNVFGNYDNLSPVAAFFIFFLLALLALAIAYILAIISCSLSCNGQVAMSYVVLISAAIFALGSLFLIGYSIYRAVKKPANKVSDF